MKGYVDDKGCLTLVGPCKEMDINGGYNVYPLEIVNIPAQHPAVSIAAVIGVPDDIEGEVGWAFLMKKTGSGASEEELKNFCKAKMTDCKAPLRCIIENALPMTGLGKIDEIELKNLVAEQHC